MDEYLTGIPDEVVQDALGDYNYMTKVWNKLAKFEKLEKEKRLIELPCSVGGYLYCITLDDNHKNFCIKFLSCRQIIISDKVTVSAWYLSEKHGNQLEYFTFGEDAFLTEEDAKNQIKNLEENING